MVTVFTVCLVGFAATMVYDFVSGLVEVWNNAGKIATAPASLEVVVTEEEVTEPINEVTSEVATVTEEEFEPIDLATFETIFLCDEEIPVLEVTDTVESLIVDTDLQSAYSDREIVEMAKAKKFPKASKWSYSRKVSVTLRNEVLAYCLA